MVRSQRVAGGPCSESLIHRHAAHGQTWSDHKKAASSSWSGSRPQPTPLHMWLSAPSSTGRSAKRWTSSKAIGRADSNRLRSPSDGFGLSPAPLPVRSFPSNRRPLRDPRSRHGACFHPNARPRDPEGPKGPIYLGPMTQLTRSKRKGGADMPRPFRPLASAVGRLLSPGFAPDQVEVLAGDVILPRLGLVAAGYTPVVDDDGADQHNQAV
jgi:hypothetical protein